MKALSLPPVSEWNSLRRGERPPLGRIVLAVIESKEMFRYGLVHATMTQILEGETPVFVDLWIALPNHIEGDWS